MTHDWQVEVGDVRLTRVVETSLTLPINLLPESNTAAIESATWIPDRSWSLDHDLSIAIQAFVLETAGATILVDPCVGNGRLRSIAELSSLHTPFLDRLTDSGFSPDSIDLVVCTHLHFDHVGWNTQFQDGAWQPTFANARYLFNSTDWHHNVDEFSKLSSDQRVVDPTLSTYSLTPTLRAAYFGQVFTDSLEPLVRAEKVDLVAGDFQVTPEVSLIPTPGHTEGHTSLKILSGGAVGFITGDSFHHEIQVANPAWLSRMDADPQLAAATRLGLLSECVDNDAVLIGTHFGGLTASRVLSSGDGVRLEAVA